MRMVSRRRQFNPCLYSTDIVRDRWGDCNDANVDINPAAIEMCDGVDNNCDLIFGRSQYRLGD